MSIYLDRSGRYPAEPPINDPLTVRRSSEPPRAQDHACEISVAPTMSLPMRTVPKENIVDRLPPAIRPRSRRCIAGTAHERAADGNLADFAVGDNGGEDIAAVVAFAAID